MNHTPQHISVCICTYKRPHLLRRLLEELSGQDTNGLFTFSIVVADNDHDRSAEGVVAKFAAVTTVSIKYCVEPEQNIALARNKAIANATGDFVALLDDDEFPIRSWLLTLFTTCNECNVDGVLGPVKPYYDRQTPTWVVKGKFYERPTYPTGAVVKWRNARTGNVLLKRKIFATCVEPFRREFRNGEDQDFFRRMIESGHVFIWCDEAVAYEVIPPIRWKRSVMLRRALLRGTSTALHPTVGAFATAKSIIAVAVYAVALPFAALAGHHRFMRLLVRLCDHLGKLLALLGINVIREPYVTE
jgi:succinoglycan biosynthesis protein ExoM